MKKIILSILLILICNSAFGQHLTFDQKIATQTGLVRYHIFDSSDEVSSWGHDIASFRDPEIAGLRTLDTSDLASGHPSLKFKIPSLSDSDTSGQWGMRFNPDGTIRFGQGDFFTFQFMIKVDRYLWEHYFLAQGGGYSDGFKFFIISRGDPGTCTPEDRSGCTGTCTALDLVMQNIEMRGYPQIYNSCVTYAPLNQYVSAGSDFDTQPWQGITPPANTYCSWPNGPTRTNPTLNAERCAMYFDGLANPSDQTTRWGTYTFEITIGSTLGACRPANEPGCSGYRYYDSNVKAWVHWMGDSSARKWLDFTFDMGYLYDTNEETFGRIWLLPYQTHKDSTEIHDETWMKVANVIIATSPISKETADVSVGHAGRLRLRPFFFNN